MPRNFHAITDNAQTQRGITWYHPRTSGVKSGNIFRFRPIFNDFTVLTNFWFIFGKNILHSPREMADSSCETCFPDLSPTHLEKNENFSNKKEMPFQLILAPCTTKCNSYVHSKKISSEIEIIFLLWIKNFQMLK